MKYAGLPCKIESGDSVVAVFLRAADWLDAECRKEEEERNSYERAYRCGVEDGWVNSDGQRFRAACAAMTGSMARVPFDALIARDCVTMADALLAELARTEGKDTGYQGEDGA